MGAIAPKKKFECAGADKYQLLKIVVGTDAVYTVYGVKAAGMGDFS